jgi:putative FmdB family regulatory protein
MPVYEYEHQGEGCRLGKHFDWEQPISSARLEACPECGAPIKRLISRTFLSSPKGDSELRDMGFTKLVKRETGVYENVTRRGNDARYMEAGKSDTLPDLKKTISD